jgi:hypothetical protein
MAIQMGDLPLPVVRTAGAAVASISAGNPAAACTSQELGISVTDGIGGAGHFSSVILVRDLHPGACRLEGYPDVRFLNAQGAVVTSATQTPRGFTGGLPAGSTIPAVDLHMGEVASAVMEGIDVPPDGATTCPTYPSYTISLPGATGPNPGIVSETIHHAVGGCSGISVHPFILGFNGTSPSGEVVGFTPTCKVPARKVSAFGPFVEIDAWSGSHLAGGVTVTASSRPTRFRIILDQGRYRLDSAHATSSRHVTVHAGRIVQLRTFGTCFQPTGLPPTFPSRTTVPAS